jgi:signal transduction histidine kinase
VAQTIFGVRLCAQQVGPAFRRGPDEGQRQVDQLLDLTRTALAQLRHACAALAPDGRCHRASRGQR